MLQPIRTQEDLPQEGATYESLRYDFKETIDPSNRRELAKDVASFANATGGVIIVGAIAQGERLASYKPLPQDHADRVLRSYDEAVRNFCSPKPVAEPEPIQLGGGIVVAVNVWPFPGQPVGVRGDGDAFRFPHRTGSNTIYLTPDQLPMFMLPEVRRIAILLASIPRDKRDVTLVTIKREGGYDITPARIDLDLDAVVMRNTLTFKKGDDRTFTIPADTVVNVYESSSEGWFVMVAAFLSIKADYTRVIPERFLR